MPFTIQSLKTETLVRELNEHASAPLHFKCDGGVDCYVKYILDTPADYDNLAYEWLGSFLAAHFGIATPQIAAVEIIEGSFDAAKLGRNKKHLKHGAICFGSIAIGHNFALDRTGVSMAKPAFYWKNKVENRLDLVKIAIFDLLVDNQDRFEENYNILVEALGTGKSKFWAIDHAAIFGGNMQRGKIHPYVPVAGMKYIASQHFKYLCKRLEVNDFRREFDAFMYLCNSLETVVNDAFDTMPSTWEQSPDLKNRILTFLTDSARLTAIEELWYSSVNSYR